MRLRRGAVVIGRRQRQVGIVALDSALGRRGGVDVYTQRLVEGIAEADATDDIHATVITTRESLPNWKQQSWPAHVEFRSILPNRQPRGIGSRLIRGLGRRLGVRVAPTEGEAFAARQIDALALDLLHFPRTLIYPRGTQTPSVLTLFDIQHEYYPEFFTKTDREFREISYGESAEAARRLIVPSEFTKCTLREKLGITEERMSVVPVGLGRRFRRESEEVVTSVRSRLSLPPRFIVYPANPWLHKNHGRLMAALRQSSEVLGECPPLVLFGRLDSETRDYRSLAQAAGVEESVIDLGFVAAGDLPAIYSAATMMVFPSLFEGFGIPLVEAMACGCPIAAARAASIPEVVGSAALLFDPTDVRAIAESIVTLWSRRDLRASLGEAGTSACEKFRWDSVLPVLLEAYDAAGAAAAPNPRGYT